MGVKKEMSTLGLKMSQEFKDKVSKSLSGRKLSSKHTEHLRQAVIDGYENGTRKKANLGKTKNQHPTWKGDKAGYLAIHAWVRRNFGKESFCEHCLSRDKNRYEWANISGDYTRERDDWIRLCRSCHIMFDKNNGKWGSLPRNKEGKIDILSTY